MKTKNDFLKVMVGVPSYDKTIFVPCVQGLMNAMKVFLEEGIPSDVEFEVGMPYVSVARNTLVRKFMESDATDLVFIDADVGFPPNAFRELIHSPENIVAGIYPKKQADEFYPVQLKTDDQANVINENGLLLATGLPTGFMKIKRTVIEQLSKAYPHLAYTDALSGKTSYNLFGTFVKDGRFYGDDYGFCKLWEDIGGKCHAIPDITFIHCGQRNFEGNFYQYLLRGSSKGAQR